MKKVLSVILFLGVVFCMINTVEAEETVWTNWIPSNEAPKVYYEKTEDRTEYRFRTKTTTTSYSTSLSGYIRDGYVLKENSKGMIDYVSSFPSGFDKNNSLYLQYNKVPIYASEDTTQKTTVSTSTLGYLYWHWCRGDHAGAINRYIESTYTQNENGTFHTFHAAFRSSALGNPKYSDGYCYQWVNSGICDSTYWWFGGDKYSKNQTTVYRCNYIKYKKLYNFYKWSDWSDWSTKKATKSDFIEVETRKTSKYRIKAENTQKNNSSKNKALIKNQKITAKSYTKSYGDKAFILKAKTNGNGKLTYKSGNKKVVTVSKKGKVKIKGCGKATITIKASATSKYKSAEKKITIIVKPGKVKLKGCKYNKHADKKGIYRVRYIFVSQKNCDGYVVKGTLNSKIFKIYLSKNKKSFGIKAKIGTTVKFRIRAYKKIGKKKIYGAWSKGQGFIAG